MLIAIVVKAIFDKKKKKILKITTHLSGKLYTIFNF